MLAAGAAALEGGSRVRVEHAACDGARTTEARGRVGATLRHRVHLWIVRHMLLAGSEAVVPPGHRVLAHVALLVGDFDTLRHAPVLAVELPGVGPVAGL